MPKIKTSNKKISVVIAAYNEAPRIAEVLKVVKDHPLIDEIIVINDGSTDKTSEIINEFEVIFIENKKNIGKTLTIKKGVKKAKNELIMLLDADLIGLSQESMNKLAEPVISGQVDWTLSLRDNSFKIMKLMKMDWLSGERVVPKNLLLDPLIWSRPEIGYSLETLMNKSLLDRGKTFRAVRLRNVSDTNKADKIGFIKGWSADVKMISQISNVVPLHQFFGQFIVMSYLNKVYNKK
jgi:glycosyltransferase involved in cell wall biosynthesis